MNDINQSNDTTDRFSKVAGTHLSRRDMMKASVVAGGLVWTAPLLLSGKAFAQSCCMTGTPVTFTISPTGVVGCEPTTCLTETFTCSDEIADCIGLLIAIDVSPVTGIAVITLDPDVALIGVGVSTDGEGFLNQSCFRAEDCPSLVVSPPIAIVPPVLPLGTIVTVTVVELLHGSLEQIELSVCLPGSATALC